MRVVRRGAIAGLWGGSLSTAAARAPSLADLRAAFRGQFAANADRWSLWTPVAFGLGCAAYFALPGEPLPFVAGSAAALAAFALWSSRRWGRRRIVAIALVLAAFALAGFAVAKLRALAVGTPVAPALQGPVGLSGYVLDIANPGEGGPRMLVAPTEIEGLAPQATPARVRLTLREPPPPPGSTVRVLTLLNPPPPPASPGGYDFARDAYFETIGGVGFVLKGPAPAAAAPAPLRLRWAMAVNAMRWNLAHQIVGVMGAETGGLAAAMVTGHQAFIPRTQIEDMRASGLAHIISISGLHMAIVGGFVFAVARLGVAAWPWLALRISSKKAAALAGLLAVGGYLIVSGAPAPAERAAITASVAFAAVLFDRRAISLHTLAIAALAVLLLQPEAVTEPGFQMSFSATAALVALAEAWPRAVREINAPWAIRAVQGALGWLAASLAASFVAGLATGPFALQHFNRMATFGLLANLAAAPISSFLMMPALAVGAVLTPFGLGDAPLAAAGWGIAAIAKIASTAAHAPGAALLVASAPAWALPTAFLGILWVCLWRGPVRWIGLPFALAVSLAPRGEPPALFVAADGAQVAVRSGRTAILLRPEVKRFAAERWAQRRGLVADEDAAGRDGGYVCDRWSCRPGPGAPVAVAAIWSRKVPAADDLAALCASAEVVIVRAALSGAACPGAILLTGADFARGGSAELYRNPEGWTLQWAQGLRGRRPWSWGVSGSGG